MYKTPRTSCFVLSGVWICYNSDYGPNLWLSQNDPRFSGANHHVVHQYVRLHPEIHRRVGAESGVFRVGV